MHIYKSVRDKERERFKSLSTAAEDRFSNLNAFKNVYSCINQKSRIKIIINFSPSKKKKKKKKTIINYL